MYRGVTANVIKLAVYYTYISLPPIHIIVNTVNMYGHFINNKTITYIQVLTN